MKIIVGLGNPDKKYEGTYHNLGFSAINLLAEKLGVTFSKEKCKSLIAETKSGGEKIILAKPQTYMNLSGDAVRELVDFYKVDLKDILVIYDDFDLPKGVLRLREKGSAGTHNGMKNIVSRLNNQNFKRIRIGFKMPDGCPIPPIDYVLSKPLEEDKPVIDCAVNKASDAAKDFAEGKDFQNIMQKYNGKA